MCKFKTYPSNLRRHKKDTTNRTNFTYGNVRVNLIFQRFISIRKTSNREINKHWEKLVCRVILFFSSRKLYHKVKPAGPGRAGKRTTYCTVQLLRAGSFRFPRPGVVGGGCSRRPPSLTSKPLMLRPLKLRRIMYS